MSGLFALLFASLLLAPPLDASALRRDEVRLLHQIVRPIDLGANLRIFDARAGEWLPTKTSDQPSASVVVVYLWTTTAPAAASELPWLREMARRVEAYHGGDARFLFISEQASAEDMKAFVAGVRDRGTQLPYFLDYEGSLALGLRQALPGAELPMPVMLLLDDRRIVRQAFVGSVATRRSEIVSGISDLLYQIRATRGNHQ